MSVFKQISHWLGERRKARYCRAANNPRAMKEDRWLALTALGEYDDPQFAVPALLARFDYNLDNGILDTREKEQAMKSLMRYDKEAVLAIAREHLRRTDHIAWTAKILLQLGGEQEVARALLACLDFSDVACDRAKVDKNYDVLCHLHDFDVSDLSRDIVHFLDDNDERVRFFYGGNSHRAEGRLRRRGAGKIYFRTIRPRTHGSGRACLPPSSRTAG